MIPEKRVWEGQTKVFDVKDVLDKRKHKNEVLLKMESKLGSFLTDSGVKFWDKHPFQWVPQEEASFLLGLSDPKFVRATVEEVEDHYSY